MDRVSVLIFFGWLNDLKGGSVKNRNTTHKDIKCQISSFLTSIIVHDITYD